MTEGKAERRFATIDDLVEYIAEHNPPWTKSEVLIKESGFAMEEVLAKVEGRMEPEPAGEPEEPTAKILARAVARAEQITAQLEQAAPEPSPEGPQKKAGEVSSRPASQPKEVVQPEGEPEGKFYKLYKLAPPEDQVAKGAAEAVIDKLLEEELVAGELVVARAEPAPVATPKTEPVKAKGKGKAKGLLFEVPEAPLPPPGATEEEALTYPRGLVGHIVQYMIDTAELPDRSMALCGALLVCALAIARKVLGPNNNAVALLTILIAESGAGKQHIINCIKLLLRAIGMPNVCVGSSIASVQAIEEVLEGTANCEGRPTALILNDEYGSFLNRIATQTGNVSEIPSHLQSLWGWPPQVEWDGAIKVGKTNKPKVWGPAFMIFGTSTEGAFFTALKSKEVGSGFVNRHLLFNCGRGAIERIDAKYDWNQCPAWIIETFKEIAGPPAPIDNRPIQRVDPYTNKPIPGMFVRDWRRTTWGEGAKEAWRHFENKEIRNLPSADEREMWIRTPEIALRLATVVSVFCGSTIVPAEIFEWGKKVAHKSCAQMVEGLQEHMLENFEQADLVKLVRDEFRKKTELRWGQVRKLCERKTNDYAKIDRVIQHLCLTKEIHEVKSDGRAGRPTERYRWTAADHKRNR